MDIFTRLKSAIKIREVHIDNNVFQLHYRVTARLLLGCAALVASKQHFGDPIDCITRDDVPNNLMDTYCWIHATFTLPDACNRTVGTEVAHPCVDKSDVNMREERVYHKYYQWVYFVLFFQAACFYAPHFFWKSCESQLLKKLCSELRDPLFRMEEKRERAMQIVNYLTRYRNMHQKYYHYFALFELINLANVIFQVYLVDQFLGGTFSTYGLEVLRYMQMEQDERVDPMVRVFPRMTKCTFHRFGSSGDVQRHDALCILPLNIINEKIYIIMWFWFLFLAIVTTLWLLYRLLTFFKPALRLEILRHRASFSNEHHVSAVMKGARSGDWYLLIMMCKNIDAQWFGFIIEQLAERLLQASQEKEKKLRKRLKQRKQRNSFEAGRGRNARKEAREPMLNDGQDYDEDEEEELEESGAALSVSLPMDLARDKRPDGARGKQLDSRV